MYLLEGLKNHLIISARFCCLSSGHSPSYVSSQLTRFEQKSRLGHSNFLIHGIFVINGEMKYKFDMDMGLCRP